MKNMKILEIRGIRFGEGIPKICIPIVGETEEEIFAQAEQIAALPADLVEWRADWYRKWSDREKVREVAGKLRELLGELPILFTFRTGYEGGREIISEEAYRDLTAAMADCDAIDLLDVEAYRKEAFVQEMIGKAHASGKYVITSNHDFEKTPEEEEILKRLSYMEELGADIAKIAVMPQSEKDVITLLGATARSKKVLSCPVITMSMGGKGAVSRMCGELTGSAVTFASAGKASAPGQPAAEDIKKILEILHNLL